MNKILVALFVLSNMSCEAQTKNVQRIRDSIWPYIVKDTAIKLDKEGQRYWGINLDPKTKYIHRHVYDSSQWILYNIRDTADFKMYTYFRELSYSMTTDHGLDDDVWRSDRQYLRTGRLLKTSKISDTTMESIHITDVSGDKPIYETWYFIGGIGGMFIKSVIDSTGK